MKDIQLFSTPSCPYAHRTRLVLHDKQVDFELIEIDLQNIPDWYLDISPNGKVPLLKNKNTIVWESAIINEYLDDLYPEPPLLPATPELRASSRIWIDYADKEFLAQLHRLLFETDTAKYDDIARKLDVHMRHLNDAGLANATPFWMGDRVTLVDYTYYPFFERFSLLEYYRDFTISPEYSNIRRWLDNMRTLPAVQATGNSPEFYIKEFAQWMS